MTAWPIYVYSTEIDGCENRSSLTIVPYPVYSLFVHLMVELSWTEVVQHERPCYWHTQTVCPRIPWSPLGPLYTNSAVMACPGDLMSGRATCVSLRGCRWLVPQLRSLSGGSGCRQWAPRCASLPRHSRSLLCLPKWHRSGLMMPSAPRSRSVSKAIYSHLLR